VFDEFDQALNTTHREAIDNLGKRQAESEENANQFITTTF
jgi:hypothetical protein